MADGNARKISYANCPDTVWPFCLKILPTLGIFRGALFAPMSIWTILDFPGFERRNARMLKRLQLANSSKAGFRSDASSTITSAPYCCLGFSRLFEFNNVHRISQ